uniref:MMS19 nucleotide excision repair protein isogeny n=1 Tax=Rhizophora mucronata TaxID=61149 RepID=A0A2P2JP86_RHIMU
MHYSTSVELLLTRLQANRDKSLTSHKLGTKKKLSKSNFTLKYPSLFLFTCKGEGRYAYLLSFPFSLSFVHFLINC